MKNYFRTWESLLEDKQTRKRIFIITLMTSLFILGLVVSRHDENSRYISDVDGNIVKIVRENIETSEDYTFKLKIVKEGNVEERKVIINKHAVSGDNKSPEQINEENGKIEQEAEISNIITDIELSDKKTIRLPLKLSDGSRLYWSLGKEDVRGFVLVPLIYVFLVLLSLKSKRDVGKQEFLEYRKSVLRALPRFTNQLMLMLNAGVILSDAFEYICHSYEIIGTDSINQFQKDLVHLNIQNQDHRLSTASLINEYAARYNIKELMRISTILMENEKRGSDIVENLNRESRYLWDDRKIVARESGKMIDTRMSYPMGFLLILLIVVTMAPAILNL